jgi:AmiR/NasT family two-component response regulator
MTAVPSPASDFVHAADLAEARAELVETRADLAEARYTIENLETALRTSREIGIAIGILMATRKLNRDQAFGLLRTASQHHHVKVRDLAEGVIFTGTIDVVNDGVEPTPPRCPSTGR